MNGIHFIFSHLSSHTQYIPSQNLGILQASLFLCSVSLSKSNIWKDVYKIVIKKFTPFYRKYYTISKGGFKNEKKIDTYFIINWLFRSWQNHFIKSHSKNQEGYKVAIIVNDIGEINVDQKLIDKNAQIQKEDTDVVGLTNGCICCTLKLDLLQQLSALASSNKFDYIIIEASGICEPIPIAQTITYANETLYSRGLPELFHLDNIICVADAARLSNEFTCGKHLLEPCEDEDSLDSLLMQQLEFCNTVILNKAETVNENEKNEIKAVIHKLCKDAGIIEASFGQVNLEELLNTHNFDYEKAQNNIGWIHEIEEHEHHHHNHEGEALEYGISTFVWQTRKPLDLKEIHKSIK